MEVTLTKAEIAELDKQDPAHWRRSRFESYAFHHHRAGAVERPGIR